MQAHGVVAGNTIASLYTAPGCAACNQTGYRGRLGLYRWLPVNADVARAIHARAADTELEALALQQDWPTLASDAARPLAAGETTLAEVLRVVTL